MKEMFKFLQIENDSRTNLITNNIGAILDSWRVLFEALLPSHELTMLLINFKFKFKLLGTW